MEVRSLIIEIPIDEEHLVRPNCIRKGVIKMKKDSSMKNNTRER
ncbi:MAG: hypothetical protein ACFE8J_19100 [Candidatus Heimdallarchaeota archaeon]